MANFTPLINTANSLDFFSMRLGKALAAFDNLAGRIRPTLHRRICGVADGLMEDTTRRIEAFRRGDPEESITSLEESVTTAIDGERRA
jgi:hypothetical protein